eukprot:Pompholyxophrys_punicea_v1_NODE_2_length_10808_cov_35.677950.p13 type:complete len:107 gc:universal NODE_2_length_10808_cov_35.677950:972-1292(+)
MRALSRVSGSAAERMRAVFLGGRQRNDCGKFFWRSVVGNSTNASGFLAVGGGADATGLGCLGRRKLIRLVSNVGRATTIRLTTMELICFVRTVHSIQVQICLCCVM